MPKFHEYKWNNSECQSWCLETPKNKLQVGQRRVRVESTAVTPREPQQLDGELLRWRMLQETAADVQVETSQLEVVIEGEVLEEVALGLHDAVGPITVGLAGATTASLCEHVLHLRLLIIDVLCELLGHAGEVAEGDPGGAVEHLLAGVRPTHLAGHHGEGLGEVDGAVDVGEHLLELPVLDLEAKGAHGNLEHTHQPDDERHDKQTRVGGQAQVDGHL
jgi:hypothetical protein